MSVAHPPAPALVGRAAVAPRWAARHGCLAAAVLAGAGCGLVVGLAAAGALPMLAALPLVLSGAALTTLALRPLAAGAARQAEAEALARRHRLLIDNSQAALWVFDVDSFRMIDSNANTAALVKMPLERFIGSSPLDFSPPIQPGGVPTLEYATQLIGRAAAGETVVAPWTFRASDGTLVPCELRATLLPMPGRRLVCGSTIDLSERERSRQELERRQALERLVAQVSTRVVGLDSRQLDSGIVQALGEIGAFAGVDRAYVYQFGSGGTTMSLTHEWCAAGVPAMGPRMIDMPVAQYPWAIERLRRGEVVDVPNAAALPVDDPVRRECEAVGTRSFVVVPMMDGSASLGFAGFNCLHGGHPWTPELVALLRLFGEMLVNVLQRRRADQALQQQAEALRRANDELTRSNTELQQFAYVASHDLQEPLRTIANFSQLLARRYGGQLDEDANTYIGFLQDAATRMHGLVTGLLEYSRIGSQASPFQRCDMQRVLSVVLGNLDASIQASRARISYGALPAVLGDEAQLVQLLQNLVGNAIKFHGERPPEVHIEATPARRAGEGWQFSVRDNGIGIRPEHATRLFQLFRRLHTQDRYPGSGIGLALCKSIVERHHGRIWVEANPQGGATFCFTLPGPEVPAAREA